jgi:integrase
MFTYAVVSWDKLLTNCLWNAAMSVKLTKSYIDRIDIGINDTFHWDSEVKGFGLRCTPKRKITFIVQGRVAGSNKEARITIGVFGVFTVDQARDAAREHLRTMRRGGDPRAIKRQDEAMKITLAQVCEQYVARPGKLKPRSISTIRRHVLTTFDDWKDKPVTAITEAMCKVRYQAILTKGLRGNRTQGSPGQANQAFSVLGALLNYAARQNKRSDGSPLIAHNPVSILKDERASLKPRTRRVIDPRIGAVWAALCEWRGEAISDDVASAVDYVRFLLLTGLRHSEAAPLCWDQVHLQDGYFRLEQTKNGNPVSMPLSTQAKALLAARPRISGSPYVFPSSVSGSHVKNPRSVWTKISEVAGNQLSAHDLRRSYTNVAMRQCRIEKFRVDLLTNHLTRDVTATHYLDTTNLQWLQPEAQMIGDYLDQQAAQASGHNVVPLRA